MEDYDLAGLWNGVAVVMSETPISGFLWARRLALVGALLILVLAGRRWSLRSRAAEVDRVLEGLGGGRMDDLAHEGVMDDRYPLSRIWDEALLAALGGDR